MNASGVGHTECVGLKCICSDAAQAVVVGRAANGSLRIADTVFRHLAT